MRLPYAKAVHARTITGLNATDTNIRAALDLFGPDPGAKAAKNRAIFFLLRICLELDQSEQ